MSLYANVSARVFACMARPRETSTPCKYDTPISISVYDIGRSRCPGVKVPLYAAIILYGYTVCTYRVFFFPRIEYVCQEQRHSVLYFSRKTTLAPVRFSHPSKYQRQNSTADFSASVFIVLPPLSEFLFIVTLLFRVDRFAL